MSNYETNANPDEITLAFRSARAALADLPRGTSKHVRATVAIGACILHGMTSGRRIVGALVKLGFDKQHAGIVLDKATGPVPRQHEWYKDEGGNYQLHDLPT